MKVKLQSRKSMSNRSYHAEGKPTWWVRIGSGNSATFVDIHRMRGDENLNVEVEVPNGTEEIHFGCGPKGSGVRYVWRLSNHPEVLG